MGVRDAIRFYSCLRGVVGTVICIQVAVPPDGPAFGCSVQGLYVDIVDYPWVVEGLVVAVAATGLLISGWVDAGGKGVCERGL